MWDEQAKFLRAARDHARVTVTSGHKTGKTRSLGVLAWWFTSDPDARPEARVPMTSSSAEQLKRALWREVTALWRLAVARGYDLPEPALDPATGVRWDDGREIFGFSTRDAERAAGVSGAWIKYLIDEASGVGGRVDHRRDHADEIMRKPGMQACEAAHADEDEQIARPGQRVRQRHRDLVRQRPA